MNMALPYMPFYVADYLGDTMHLTLEQHGAYVKLLMCMWRSNGQLPNDRAQISRMLGITPRRWDVIGADVMAFFEVQDDVFTSRRLTEELQKTEGFLAQKSAAGKASASAKLRKNLETVQRAPQQPEPESEPDLFGDSLLPATPPVTPREAAEAIWQAAPKVARKRSSTEQVLAALEAARKRGKNLAVIRQAVGNYFADPDVVKEDYRWAKGVHRVIQNDFWETWAQAESVEHIDTGFLQRKYRTWMQDFLANPLQWRHHERGPSPDQPGCKVPAEIMAEFGYAPPARRAQA